MSVKNCPSCGAALVLLYDKEDQQDAGGSEAERPRERGWYCDQCGIHLVPGHQLGSSSTEAMLPSGLNQIKSMDGSMSDVNTDSLTRDKTLLLGLKYEEEYQTWENRIQQEFSEFISSIRQHFTSKEKNLQEYQIDLCQREKDLLNNEEEQKSKEKEYQQRLGLLKEAEDSLRQRMTSVSSSFRNKSLGARTQCKGIQTDDVIINGNFNDSKLQSIHVQIPRNSALKLSSDSSSNSPHYRHEQSPNSFNNYGYQNNVHSNNRSRVDTSQAYSYTDQHRAVSRTSSGNNGAVVQVTYANDIHNQPCYNGYQNGRENDAPHHSLSYGISVQANRPYSQVNQAYTSSPPEAYHQKDVHQSNKLYGSSNTSPTHNQIKSELRHSHISESRNHRDVDMSYTDSSREGRSLENSYNQGGVRDSRASESSRTLESSYYGPTGHSPLAPTNSHDFQAESSEFYERSSSRSSTVTAQSSRLVTTPGPTAMTSAKLSPEYSGTTRSEHWQYDRSRLKSPPTLTADRQTQRSQSSDVLGNYGDRPREQSPSPERPGERSHSADVIDSPKHRPFTETAPSKSYSTEGLLDTSHENPVKSRRDLGPAFGIRHSRLPGPGFLFKESAQYREAPPYNGPPAYSKPSKLPSPGSTTVSSPPLHSRESSVSGQGEAAIIESRTLDVQVARSKAIVSNGSAAKKVVKFGVAVYPDSTDHLGYPKTPIPRETNHEDSTSPDMTSTPVEEHQPSFPISSGYNTSTSYITNNSTPASTSKVSWADNNLQKQSGNAAPKSALKSPVTNKPSYSSRPPKETAYVRTGLKQPAAYRSPMRLNSTKSSPSSETHVPSYTQRRVQPDIDLYKNANGYKGHPSGKDGPPAYREINNNNLDKNLYYKETTSMPTSQPSSGLKKPSALPGRASNFKPQSGVGRGGGPAYKSPAKSIPVPGSYRSQRPEPQQPVRDSKPSPLTINTTEEDGIKERYFDFSPTYKSMYDRYQIEDSIQRHKARKEKEKMEAQESRSTVKTWRSRSRLPNYNRYISEIKEVPVTRDTQKKK